MSMSRAPYRRHPHLPQARCHTRPPSCAQKLVSTARPVAATGLQRVRADTCVEITRSQPSPWTRPPLVIVHPNARLESYSRSTTPPARR